MSEREKAGLRGPVQQCIEEQTIPAFENFPATTYTITTKYSREGRILQSATANLLESRTLEVSTTYTYDSSGRLLKKMSTNPGSPASESKYDYDEKGRIISITGDPLGSSTFEYDDNGRKIRIMSPISAGLLLAASTAYEFPMPEDQDSYLPIPIGGHAKIFFNNQDQPAEWQVSDANGNLTNRLIRTYDENGRLTELRYTVENILPTLPAETQQQFLADPGAAEELAKQFTKLLGKKHDFTRTTYRYDAEDRITEKHEYMGPSMEIITKTAYKDRSDKLEKHTVMISDPNPPNDGQSNAVLSSAPLASQKSQTRYSYKYDKFGNWTEQAISSSTSPNDATITRRTITYY